MSGTLIETVEALRVWDSRGRPTVEATVLLAGGATGSAIAPAGASTGSGALALGRGASAIAPAAAGVYRLEGDGAVYRASTPPLH